MNAHLLSLATLHAAAPGVLDVVFGPDGDFEGAPLWTPALYMMVGRRFVHDWQRTEDVIWLDLPPHGLVAHGQVALDLRVPSVAARLAGLCARAGYPDLMYQDNEVIAQARYGGPGWTEAWAVRLVALTISLAPRIAALRKP